MVVALRYCLLNEFMFPGEIFRKFKTWVWSDSERTKRLQGAYNRRYGNIRKRNFDGSFFEFPDMNPDIELRPHQKNAVARIIFSDNTLLAHDVGAGKTYTMIAAGMELKRLGKSQKNMYVIPNNIDDCSDCDMYLTDEKVCYCLNTKDGEYCERFENRRLRSGKIKKGEKNEFPNNRI